MLRLQSFPKVEASNIRALRRKAAGGAARHELALGLALADAGCSYEAALILRPIRSHWKSTGGAPQAEQALDAQAWWNKNWRTFARLRHAGQREDALALLGDRSIQFWDFPPLLMHLGAMAVDDARLDLADHIFQRVLHLTERGLPKMPMQAFVYVAQAARVDVLCRKGDAAAALKHFRTIAPNSGNAMGHTMQLVELLVAAGHLDEAMGEAASVLATATTRNGYSKDMRLDFIATSSALAPLRKRSDWRALLQDPGAYVRTARKQKIG
jgi:hypothetical protein